MGPRLSEVLEQAVSLLQEADRLAVWGVAWGD